MQPLGLCASLRGRIGNKTFDETRAMCVVFRRFTVLEIDFFHCCGSPGAHTSIIIQTQQQVYFVYRLIRNSMLCTQTATSFFIFLNVSNSIVKSNV